VRITPGASWGDCSEHLTRCYGIIGEGKKAREQAGDAKSRYVKLLEDGELVPYELILEGRMNPYIGLGLCEETLGNLDSAAEWFSKAEGAYQRLLDSRKDVRDYVSLLSDWKNAAILCGSMRKKVELKRDGATTSKGDEYLNSFFELAEGTWGVPFVEHRRRSVRSETARRRFNVRSDDKREPE
jgi:hypothetical protein